MGDPGTYLSEKAVFTDPQTGRRVIRWTASDAKDQHLYFTSPSVTADDRWIVFLTERTGHPNLAVIDRRSGGIRMLTNNTSGLLRSYVYATGGETGLSKASPCLDAAHGVIYYIANQAVWRLDLPDGRPQELWPLPQTDGAAWWSAFNHVSPDGHTLCVPLTDPRAFAEADTHTHQHDQMRDVPRTMREAGLVSRLYAIDTTTGIASVLAEVPVWVTHVQFDPAGTGRIVFNSEGHGRDQGRYGNPRIWVIEPGGRPRPLFDQSPAEYVSCCHENWTPDGRGIVYHGERWLPEGGGVGFVAVRDFEGHVLFDASLPKMRYGHATPMPPDGRRVVIDGVDRCVSLLTATEAGGWRLEHLCRHDTDRSMRDQDAHAHPLVTTRGTSIIFTSDRENSCNVYEVICPDLTYG